MNARPATRRTHAQRSHETQARLVQSAIRLIEDRGYEAASLFEVAKAAGVTPGAIQHHFESKAALMMRVLRELLADGQQRGGLWPSPDVPVAERARQFIDNIWTLAYCQPRFIAAWNIYLGSRAQPEVIGHIADLRRELSEQMRADFAQAFPELAHDAGRDTFFDLVLSALRGMGLLEIFETGSPAVRSQLDALAELITQRCTR